MKKSEMRSNKTPKPTGVAPRVKPFFLNVDLDIESASKLDSVAAEMGRRVFVLYSGPSRPRRYLLKSECARFYRNPNAAIHGLCSIVESLTPASQRICQRARKAFDVGYELMPSETSSQFSLRPDTIRRVAALGATLTVTYYRGGPNDAP
jgi:hypothetical protein